MKTIPATNFKTHCLSLLAEVARNHQPIIVTKRGKPLVKVAPVNDNADVKKKPLKGNVIYWGDVFSPIDIDWEAEKDRKIRKWGKIETIW